MELQKCNLCWREHSQSSTEKKTIFDAYCIACRGLFNHYTKVKKWSDKVAKNMIVKVYRPIQKVKAHRNKRLLKVA